MGKVTGLIPFHGDELVELPFGQWFLRMIGKEAANEAWAFKRDALGAKHLYLWVLSEVVPGKDVQHFRDKEHLHLIDNDTDVDISTKHPQALDIAPGGTYEKRTATDKEPQHLTGTKALNRGDSLPITICTRNATPDEVVGWQKELIIALRTSAYLWLKDCATPKQLEEFLAT